MKQHEKSLEEKLKLFKIGDDISISGGMGDWDNGVVTGIDITIRYRVRTEYGTEYWVDEDKIIPPQGD